MRWLRRASFVMAGLMVFSACGVVGGDSDEGGGEVDDGETTEESVSVADAPLTIEVQADTVNINGDMVDAGLFQDGASGDVVEIIDAGSAIITAESVFQIEALRGAKVTVPDLTSAPLDVTLEYGHLFVRLNPEANISLVVDTGARQFTTLTPDAEFAMCQSPEGASCLTVLNGQVEWNEGDVATEVYAGGEASFAAPGDAPDPARCADQAQISDMQRSLRGQDFAGALADIVATWEPCEEGAEDDEVAGPQFTVPSAARMEHVVIPEPQIGSPDVDNDAESLIAQRALDEPYDYYIEPRSVTNGEFRTWLANTAGDDPDVWAQYAPQDWIDRAPGGAATQAIYAPDTADDSVKGIAYDTAVAFCEAQVKRLPTEIEWELAAVEEILEDVEDSAHDWVSDYEAYAPGPEGDDERQVLRGTNGVDEADPYFRVFAPTSADATAALRDARIRCAAGEVAIGGQPFENVILRDDFNALGWPLTEEDPFELDYHPENYHLDLTAQHSQAAVIRPLDSPLTDGRIDIDLFIERNNTGTDTGNFRFGAVFGTGEDLHTLTIQPDNFSGDEFAACLMPIDPELLAALDLGGSPLADTPDGRFGVYAPGEGHYGEDCTDADSSIDVAVANIDNPVRLSIVVTGGQLEVWVNDALVEATSAVTTLDSYGFFTQLYHRDRSHIHYNDLIVSTS